MHKQLYFVSTFEKVKIIISLTGIAGLEEASSGWEVSSGWGGAGGGGAGTGGCGGGCVGCGACAPLPPAWMKARAAALNALARTVHAARTLCTQPPPAIAHTFSQVTC